MLISVIIPAYNAAETIGEALDSVWAQEGVQVTGFGFHGGEDGGRPGNRGDSAAAEIEMIVIDDASTDNTVGAVNEWLQAHASVNLQLLCQEQNRGPAAARNRGIAAARGEWIAFLDGDDGWLPNKLSAQIQCLRENTDLRLLSGSVIPFESEAPSISAPVGTPCERLDLERLVPINIIATSTAVLSREAFDAVGGFDEQFRGPEDYDLWLRVAARYPVGMQDAPMAAYRGVEGSLSHDERTFLPQVLRVLEKAFGKGGAFEALPHLKRTALSSQYVSASWMAFVRGDRARALTLWMWACLNACLAKKTHYPLIRLLVRYLVGSRKE